MSRLSWAIVIFSVAFAAVHLIPIGLGKPLPGYRLITIGTVFDLITPLILLPIYVGLYQWGHVRSFDRRSLWWGAAFLVSAVLWVEGHSIHLPANAISLTLRGAGVGSNVQSVTHLFDEVLGHYFWHAGMVGLSMIVVAREWLRPIDGQPSSLVVGMGSGTIYGGIFFGAVVEGGTWPLGVTFAALFTVGTLIWGWARLRRQPLLAFFAAGYLVASVLFIGWAIRWWGGFPQFSEVGIIN